MKHIYPIILLLFLGTTAKVYGQKVYAIKVLEVSREYSAYPGDNCAAQILGTPNVYPTYGDIEEAWTPTFYGDQRDTITLLFNHGAPIDSIFIYQTHEPGLVDSVWIKDDGLGTWNLVYSNAAPAPTGSGVAEMLKIGFPMTSYNVSEVRIGMATDLGSDYVEIDAVAISPGPAINWSIPAGNTLTFDGTDDSFQSQLSSSVAGTASRKTITAWVKVDGAAPSVVDVYEGAAIVSDGIDSYFGIYQANLGGGDSIYFYSYTSGISYMVSVPYTVGEWMHLAYVHNNDTLKAYKNGILIDELQTPATEYMGGFIEIGVNSYYGEFFQGEVSSVTTYKTGLTDDQVRERIHVTPTGNETGLTAHFSFDNDPTYYTTGYNLINNGGISFAPSVLPVGPGKAGSQIETNGAVSFVASDFSANYTAQSAGEVTVSRISNLPYAEQAGTVVENAYWVVNQFNGTTFTADYSFTITSTIDPNLADCDYVVYGRGWNESGTWNVIDTADVVAANLLTFEALTDSLGQFYIVREGACTSTADVQEQLTELDNITLYPNPSNGQVNIDLSESAIDFELMTISNELGQVVYQENINGQQLVSAQTDLESGVYFVVLHSSTSKSINKVIITK